jgi:oligopeptidase B
MNTPPLAARIPTWRTTHGEEILDEFAWLSDTRSAETLAFLDAQNAYAMEANAGQVGLRDEIFAEITARTQEADITVPARKGDWWYYTRTIEGAQYEIHCRCPVPPGEDAALLTATGAAPAGEEILLDGNALAQGRGYFSLGACVVSPAGTAMCYSTDLSGEERFTLRVRDLVTGEVLRDEVYDVFYGVAWSADGSTIFYVRANEAWRPWQVWRHVIGTAADEDVIVYQEDDARYGVTVSLTRSELLVLISVQSKLASEVWLIDAARPETAPSVVAMRRDNVTYTVDHQGTGDRLLIVHNTVNPNFELAEAPVAAPGQWRTLLPGRDDTRLVRVLAFDTYVVVCYRRDGLTGLRVLRTDGVERDIPFDEPIYTVLPGVNLDRRSRIFRLSYGSFATPDSTCDYDTEAGALTLLRRRPVLGLPGGPDFDPNRYEQRREWAVAADGTRIPISMVCLRGTPRDGSAPLMLFGYGSYEISVDPSFANPRLSLLDRGVGFAIAHVRGGGELGRRWYDDGKLLRKKNSISDFVACARHLVAEGWTSAGRLVARGGSAGGLLVAAAVNAAPDAFGGVVAQVPFVDALTTILDPSRPLTVSEWDEWGNPLHDPVAYAYIKGYSPYDNIDPVRYPPILAIAGMNDARVSVGEAAKWIARLQSRASGGPFLLVTEMVGHVGQSGRYDAWRQEASILAWTIDTVRASSDSASTCEGIWHGADR